MTKDVLRRVVVGPNPSDVADPVPLFSKGSTQRLIGRGPSRRTQVRFAAGTYAHAELQPGGWVDIVGDDRRRTVIAGENPDDESPDRIRASETFHWRRSGRLQNLTVTIRNGRYPLHLDSRGKNINCLQEMENVTARHLGNDGARAYQLAQFGPKAAAAVWPAENAVGLGTSSGSRYRFMRSEFIGNSAGMAIHNNLGFDVGAEVLVEGCLLAGLKDVDGHSSALRVRSLGSNREDRLILNGCTLAGDLFIGLRTWFVEDLGYQPANHNEFAVSGYGNRPFVTRVNDFGRALRIDSRRRSKGSRVRVTGSAAALIFGPTITEDGAQGIPGYALGTVDVSGVPVGPKMTSFITSLGMRLGDCRARPKSLAISVDGGTKVAISFDRDYTRLDNDAIVNELNAVLGQAAVAYLDKPGNRVRPRFSDEEGYVQNTSSVAIRMFQVLAYHLNDRSVRLMTRDDDPARFAGVAWEDMRPADWGRAKLSGHLPIQDLSYAGGYPVLALGVTHSIKRDRPGDLAVGGTQGLLPAIRRDAVTVSRLPVNPKPSAAKLFKLKRLAPKALRQAWSGRK